MTKVPEKLKAGDTVGIVAPSGRFDRDKFYRGVEIIESMGLRVTFPKGIFDACGYLSAPDDIRAAHLEAAFADPDVKAVLCARGGYGAVRVLTRLDFEKMRSSPKWFVGFSDITALLAAIYGKCGFAVLHGPMAATLTDMDETSITLFQKALMDPEKYRLPLDNCRIIQPGKAFGKVCGGNLTTLCHLIGTEYQPRFANHILFLEDTGEAAYRIDRMMHHLLLSGCLRGIRGVVLGTFHGCGDYGRVVDIMCEVLEGSGIPIVADFPAGHGSANVAIPMGTPAVLDTEAGSIAFGEE
ncbi:MAG: LD-carboxypeptidase [Desulfobacterales bacterium]